MFALIVALAAGLGVHLLYTSIAYGERAVVRSRRRRRSLSATIEDWLTQAGLAEVSGKEFVSVSFAIAGGAALIGYAAFGGVVPAIGISLCAGTAPFAVYRSRRAHRRVVANDAWPQMIEEIRVLTSSAGRSIPQALFEVGLHGPEELRNAFVVAQREWNLSTDFDRTVRVLTSLLSDPVADAACETLLVAHQVGGSGLDRRLSELAEDRRLENLGRKDARAKQAGIQFARKFVIIVPAGMAAAGMSLGDGRQAYQTVTGQVLVALGVAMVAACWMWSGKMLKLPEHDRVFR